MGPVLLSSFPHVRSQGRWPPHAPSWVKGLREGKGVGKALNKEPISLCNLGLVSSPLWVLVY